MLTAIGMAIGLIAAAGLTRFVASLLIGVSATDAVSFVAVSAIWCAVAVVASYVPARRALKVDASISLRHD